MREINQWLCKNGKTHLLLDGGTLTAKEGFYEAYIRDLLNGEKLCVVEKKTTQFRFFIDVDIEQDEEVDVDFVSMALMIDKIVNLGPCVLATTKGQLDRVGQSSNFGQNNSFGRKTSKGTYKYGLHMIWIESVVNKQKANGIRINLIDALGSDWEKVIDASVYSGSGLRMIWSLKNEEGSIPYVPWGSIRDGVFKEFGEVFPSVEYLRLFSIRIVNSETCVQDSSKNTSDFTDLEKFIQSNIPGQSRAKVVKISKCKNKKDYWISTNSRYCHNIKREHKSNHVWFVLKPGGLLAQKCQDDECKGFTGRFYRIPSRLIPNEGVLDTGTHSPIYDYFPNGWKNKV